MTEEHKGTVLVVDDEAANLGVLFEFLRQANFRVLIAENGKGALERVKRSQPDIILLDVKMPDMDGFELYRRLKEGGQVADAPVIFLTSLTETMDKVRAFDMNAVDYITKPFQPLEVVARVEKHLTLRNLRWRLEEQNAQLQREIAERERAEAALAEKSIYLDNILRSASEYAIITTDLDFRITYFNPLAEEFYGCPAVEAIGKTVQEVCPWGMPTEHFEQGIENVRTHGEHRYVMVQEIDGRTRHFAARVSGITDQEGELVGYARFSRDITARVQADEELRKLSQAVERSANSVIITDLDGNIEYVNPRFTQVSGYTSEEVLGKNPRILMSKTDPLPPEEYKRLWETITAGNEWRGEVNNQTKDGKPYWQFATITPIKDAQGVITHFLAIQEDISARVQAEAALQKAKEAATEAMRELRVPINAILNFAQLLERDPDATPAQRENLEVISRSSEQLLELIEGVPEIPEWDSRK